MEADITLANCLNLASGIGQLKLQPFYCRYISIVDTEKAPAFKQKTIPNNRDFDYHVINLACNSLKERGAMIHVVRGAFKEGSPIYSDPNERYPTSGISLEDHVQLAVRDTCAILDTRKLDPVNWGV